MGKSPVKASLKSESSQIVAGRPFKVFVDFTMEPGWHIYYKNPGQTGMPTEVKFTLPPGFKVGPLTWPKPETFKEAGIVTYGYSKNVRLSTVMIPAKSLKPSSKVTIKGKASWLACKHSCVPGESPDLVLALKVRAK
jgi:thiol:disulfide interchange protein DsbD